MKNQRKFRQFGFAVLAITCIFLLYQLFQCRSSKKLLPMDEGQIVASKNLPTKPDAFDPNGPHNFRRPNMIISHYDEYVANKLAELIGRKAPARDPELVKLVQQMMDPPATGITKTSKRIVLTQTPQSQEIDRYFNEKRNGFFIDCGAFDGELSSNTVWLEQARNWTGILVEADHHFYTQILGKRRHSWSIHGCLSLEPYVTQKQFFENANQLGRLNPGDPDAKDAKNVVPCFPVETLLHAVGVNTVDYFSLDVEGVELEVLKTIPFDKIDITSLSVEYAHGKDGAKTLADFMTNYGYFIYKDVRVANYAIDQFSEDYIFVKNNYSSST